MKPIPHRQRGVALFVGLVMLVLMTLLVIGTFNLGKSSLQIVGNFQWRNEAIRAAQEAIETVLSTSTITTTDPTAVASIILPGCSGANTVCVDVNGDGTNDVTVLVTGRGTNPNPSCIKKQVVANAQLDLSTSDGLGCVASNQGFGVAGLPTGDSLCNEALYEIVATATDNVTQTSVTVTEGVGVRVPIDSILNYCK